MKKKIIVIVLSLLFLGIGIYTIKTSNAKAERCTEETSGVVVNVIEETSKDSDGNISRHYYPVLEYQVGEEIAHEKYSVGSGNSSKYRVGDEIDILYNPSNNEEFIIKGDSTLKILGYAFTGMGALFAILGVVSKNIS